MHVRFLSCWLAAAVFVMAMAATASAPRVEFICTLSANSSQFFVGDRPIFEVRILNHSPREVRLVGALEGSNAGWRYPKCQLEVFDASGQQVMPNTHCGNRDLLREVDFVRVAPGQEFNPAGGGLPELTEPGYFPVTRPGLYTVRFRYATAPDVRAYQLVPMDSAAQERLQQLHAQVPLVNLQSEELTLQFVDRDRSWK